MPPNSYQLDEQLCNIHDVLLNAECRDLITRCLSYKPADRPTLSDIRQHSWLNASQLHWSCDLHCSLEWP